MTRPVEEDHLSKLVPNIPVGPNRNGWFHLMYQPKFLSLKLSVALFLAEFRWPVVYFFFFSVFLDLFLYIPNLWT